MENSVEAAMSKEIEAVDISSTAEQAAKKMRDKKVGSLLVIDGSKSDHPAGIVTERDLVRRVCAEGIGSKEVQVQRLMSSPIATIEPRATLGAAASVMLSNKTRHLLVVDNDKRPVGMITSTDLTRYLQASMNVDEVNARILEAVLEDEEPLL
jgi:signal-transduction protein with cAMP-binding, CBS, and nucleotidyltransferase domain